MVIAIEPKVFLPNFGIIGVENTYLMQNDHLLSLTGFAENSKDRII